MSYTFNTLFFHVHQFTWQPSGVEGTTLTAFMTVYQSPGGPYMYIISASPPSGSGVANIGSTKYYRTSDLSGGSNSVLNPGTPSSGSYILTDIQAIMDVSANFAGSSFTDSMGCGTSGIPSNDAFWIVATATSPNRMYPDNETGIIVGGGTTNVPSANLVGAYLACKLGGDSDYTVFGQITSLCFHGDTLIETDKGRIAARDLKRGDMVRTYQEGFQPVSRALRTLTGGRKEFTVIDKDALKPGVPSEKFIVTNRHPIKYGSRFVTPGRLATSPLTKHPGIRIETIKCEAYYTLQFDRHYTFSANGVETSSIPTTTGYSDMHLRKDWFHNPELYDESKIGGESTWLYTSAALRRPLTKEDVNSFKMQDAFSRNVCETLRCCPPLLEKLGRETYAEELCSKCRTLLGGCVLGPLDD